ncbi:MAG: hypothetical protein RQ885_09230, partial [Desulfurococcales archaeon]|nr:hypothetical protein [Desulfurococcales archaeon]
IYGCDDVYGFEGLGADASAGHPVSVPPMSLGGDPEAYPQPDDHGDRSIDPSPGGLTLETPA